MTDNSQEPAAGDYRPRHFEERPIRVTALQVPPPESEIGEEAFMTGHGHLLGWLMALGFDDFMIADDKGVDIYTTAGVLHASPGDWLVRHASGEIFPLKPDSLNAIYREVTSDAQ